MSKSLSKNGQGSDRVRTIKSVQVMKTNETAHADGASATKQPDVKSEPLEL
jgi:hypothetical protein